MSVNSFIFLFFFCLINFSDNLLFFYFLANNLIINFNLLFLFHTPSSSSPLAGRRGKAAAKWLKG